MFIATNNITNDRVTSTVIGQESPIKQTEVSTSYPYYRLFKKGMVQVNKHFIRFINNITLVARSFFISKQSTISVPEDFSPKVISLEASFSSHLTKAIWEETHPSGVTQQEEIPTQDLIREISLSYIIEPVQSLDTHPLYYSISRSEAEKRLKNQKTGIWLLRPSSQENQFAISYVNEKKEIKHLLVASLADLEKYEQQVQDLYDLTELYVYHGDISRNEAEKRLDGQPIGTGLLRYSSNVKDFVLSVKQKHTIIHTSFEDNTLEQMKQFYQIKNLIPPKQMEQAKPQESKLSRKYDQQMILDLGSGHSAQGLTAKAHNKKLSSTTIDLKNKNHDFSVLSHLTLSSRIYIIGHSGPGRDSINSDGEQQMSVEEYVKMLTTHAPQLKNSSSSEKIKISVIACFGGVDGPQTKSFGYQLSQALDLAEIQAEVFARTHKVDRWSGDNAETYKKLVNGKYHKNDTKVGFTTSNRQTTVTPFEYK